MSIELYLVALILAFVVLYYTVPSMVGAYIRFRGTRVVTCPETRKTVAVEVDAGHAALTATFTHRDLRLQSCTRWPERRDCGQDCLLQVELSPEDCLVRTILTSWYHGKHCVSCGTQFGAIRWSDHKPGLLSPEGQTVDWGEIPPEKVPEMLATHFPVCWDCLIVETFCRAHPELIVDRSQIAAGMHLDLIA